MPGCFFFDTSALFKRYRWEEGSNVVAGILQQDAVFYISAITLCEVISNLRRLADVDGLISPQEFEVLRATFLGDVGERLFEVIEVTADIILTATDLASQKYIAPLDAIQIATALSVPEKPAFVCADQKLIRIAVASGLHVMDPLHPGEFERR
ncbi:MAG: PIN domain-containing protein [Clostridia bacterium]|nr:MAG: PIN domain-containing protein [Clostridia bacterium]